MAVNSAELLELFSAIVRAAADGRFEGHEIAEILDEADDLIPMENLLTKLGEKLEDVLYQDSEEKLAKSARLRDRAQAAREAGRLKRAARLERRAADLAAEAAELIELELALELAGGE